MNTSGKCYPFKPRKYGLFGSLQLVVTTGTSEPAVLSPEEATAGQPPRPYWNAQQQLVCPFKFINVVKCLSTLACVCLNAC